MAGLITNIYLSAAEYDLLACLPGEVLTKTRVSVPPLGVDVFDPPLHGLVLAEAEFGSDELALSFPVPAGAVAEVTDDSRGTAARAPAARGAVASLPPRRLRPRSAGPICRECRTVD